MKKRTLLWGCLVLMMIMSGCGMIRGASGEETVEETLQMTEPETEPVISSETVFEEDEQLVTLEVEEETREGEADEGTIGYNLQVRTRLNLRAQATADCESLGRIEAGEIITGLEYAGGWWRVYYNEMTGYVAADYVNVQTLQNDPSAAAETAVIGAEESADPNRTEDRLQNSISGSNGYVIVIDAGHQAKANSGKEPVGPGSGEMKAKVSSGTAGHYSGLSEYELNLQVALRLQKELESRGYQVVMIRTTHDVDISNSERAAVANEAHAAAFIRIHADGSENSSAKGAFTICQTAGNPYNGQYYEDSRRLSECVLEEYAEATHFATRSIWETDTMSGINWCQVPVTIIEMGYMSNKEEDLAMADPDNQDRMAAGMANGIDRFLNRSN